jgi:hypothetical protein
MLFLPRAVMHEISIPKGELSLSIGFRGEHVYPAVEVITDLNRMAKDSTSYSLPETARSWMKFKAKVFNPSNFVDSLNLSPEKRKMPELLKSDFQKLIISKNEPFAKKLPILLDQWWKELCDRKNYSPVGPLPTPPEDRATQLKHLEKKRLSPSSE